MNILLVEPDRILGQTTKSVLEAAGYEVVWKRTAQTALDALDAQLPDLIVLELQLGTHNGVEFLYELASYQEWRELPVIIHTINPKAQDGVFADALEQLKVRTVLYKPRTPATALVSAMKQFA